MGSMVCDIREQVAEALVRRAERLERQLAAARAAGRSELAGRLAEDYARACDRLRRYLDAAEEYERLAAAPLTAATERRMDALEQVMEDIQNAVL